MCCDLGGAVHAGDVSHGKTPLHHALELNNTAMVDGIMRLGGDLSIKDHNGDTPLHLAARKNHLVGE
jgi:ankyrin repeat protein